jgi:hypothetical protein
MPRPKTTKPRSTAAKKKKESLKAIYARLKREFTAADLQKYTVIEPMVPAEQVLAKMKEMYRQHLQKKKATNGRKR